MYKLILILVVTAFILSCETNDPNDEISQWSPDELSGQSLAVIAKDKNKNILFGVMQFEPFKNNTVSGKWRFETWGEQKLFKTLPVNMGDAFPETADLGLFTGIIHGNILIINIELEDGDSSLGVIINGKDNDMIKGRISLLPDKEFDGIFEAVLM